MPYVRLFIIPDPRSKSEPVPIARVGVALDQGSVALPGPVACALGQ